MPGPTHQTVKLGRGRHASPREGMCVLELASVLGGERFSDHPASVCPVIGSVLRSYNDSVEDDRRQSLLAYAAAIVGTRSSHRVQEARAARVVEWAEAMRFRRRPRVPATLRRIGMRHAVSGDSLGTLAVRAIRRHSEDTHAQVLALLDELIAMGSGPPERRVRATPALTWPDAASRQHAATATPARRPAQPRAEAAVCTPDAEVPV